MAINRFRAGRTVAVIAALAWGLAACGGGTTTGGSQQDEGTPVTGGTLKLVGAGDVDHLDTAGAYYSVTYTLLRAISRQLVSYPNSSDPGESTTPAPDLAEEIGEPTDGGTTYTFKIREGAQWDAPGGPRQIVAEDVVRGFKRLCNPVTPTGAPGYFTGTIVGMQAYCEGFAKVPGEVGPIKDYIEQTSLEGVTALDERTVQFKLLQPASDFINILALPFSSPVPVEALEYKPDSPEFRRNFVASGPYKIESYTPNQSIKLTRNPAWKAEADPLRKAYVDRIEITQGSDEGPVQKQLEAGTADMQWDTQVPVADLRRLQDANDSRLSFNKDGSSNPYLVMNLQSPNENNALANVKVRQALNYAVDKQSIVQTLGGPKVTSINNNILTPAINGFEAFDLYPTPDSKGDPARAKTLLTEAGYPNGLNLKMVYRNAGKAPAIAQTLQQGLAKAGVNVELVSTTPPNFYTQFLQNPQSGQAGDWDIAAPGWGPDWAGNAARSFFVPLLDGRNCGPGSTNYGCYNNPAVNTLIDEALAAKSVDDAAAKWAQADRKAMEDAVWVPLVTGNTLGYHSERVKGWKYFFPGQNGDVTNVWLAG
ncbi:MAG: ABC transporter substrate-binding protein [Sporichthyaceae bacterium]|nr:ABC transporter substrate-binding protein [Sporichthyaceae bacterium]